jgi:hypothetical protein
MDFIGGLAEHRRKCFKVEYLGRTEYDFQKSRVTGPWDHKVSVSAKKIKTKFHACEPLKKRCNHSSIIFFPEFCTFDPLPQVTLSNSNEI